MKKTIINVICAICVVGVFASCTLEREDYTEISPETFPQTETDLELAVNQLYVNFAAGGWGTNTIFAADNSGYQTFSDMGTDLLWCCWEWEWDKQYYHQGWNPVDSPLPVWNHFTHYQFLSKARNTIRRIEASSAPESAKRLYAAEVPALRGWMALYLYDLFGPVPVASDEVLDQPEEFVYLPRLTDEEYDEMMENDLRTAIAVLPEKRDASELGRVTKGAAMMMLLKYYMIRGKFQQAETMARELMAMEGGIYNLQPDYNRIFTIEGEGNDEIILQVPCTSTATWLANHVTAECLPGDMPWTDKGKGWGGYVIPWDYYDTFDPSDVRRQNIVTSYVSSDDGQVYSRENPKAGTTQLKKGALPLKYGKDPDMTAEHSGVDIVVYRFSDVLLTVAECIVRNGGSVTGEAVNLVNRVRNRAGLPNLDDSQTASKDAFLEALLEERGHEFWLEGLRRQDLIRFGKYVEYANKRIEVANANGANYYPATEAQNRFWIPQSFIDESMSAIKQNPGY